MRVLFVTTRYPPHAGGVERHVAALAEGLVAQGHDVTVFTADASTADAPRRERRRDVRVRRFRSVAPDGAFHVAPGLVRAVRGSAADLVHAHNYHSLPLLFAALGTDGPGFGSGTPLVATPHYHGASASAVRDRLLSVYRLPGGWALRRAERVIAVSDWERERLADDFGVRATVIPNGLATDRFADASPPVSTGTDPAEVDGGHPTDSEHPADGRPYLLSVGRLAEYKGVQHVVRALPDLEYDLVVAGAGDYADELRRTARETGVADRVHFLGYVPDDDLPALYAGAAAFVTCSGFEAYGMTVAEALASGTPCVVRRAGALADWTDRADCVGVGSESGVSPAQVADGVREAVGRDAPSDPLPTWDDVVAETETLYRAVLGSA
jgi:glycosyltransferase involved in cell wall biosynthesis